MKGFSEQSKQATFPSTVSECSIFTMFLVFYNLFWVVGGSQTVFRRSEGTTSNSGPNGPAVQCKNSMLLGPHGIVGSFRDTSHVVQGNKLCWGLTQAGCLEPSPSCCSALELRHPHWPAMTSQSFLDLISLIVQSLSREHQRFCGLLEPRQNWGC